MMPKIKQNKQVQHSSQKLFELVNKVEDYPKFLPWCTDSKIISQKQDAVKARLSVAKGPFRQDFATENTLEPYTKIKMHYLSGPFKKFYGEWSFKELSSNCCQVEFDLEYEFNNMLTARALIPIFNLITDTMIDSFIKRADEIYHD